MTIEEFFKDPLFDLPVLQPPRQDFKQFVFRQLDQFNLKLEQLYHQEAYFSNLGHYPIELIWERQRYLSDKIKETINAYYNGKPSEAYAHMSKGLVSQYKDFNEILNLKTFDIGENFYRIRIHKENFPLPTDSFFHIPFEKRGLVKTQRFSIPDFHPYMLDHQFMSVGKK